MPVDINELVAAARSRIREVEPGDCLAGEALVVDVREPAEFAQGHLPGAVNLPRGVLEFAIEAHPALACEASPTLADRSRQGAQAARREEAELLLSQAQQRLLYAGDLDGAQEVCFVELTPAQPLTMEGTTQVTLRWAQPQERGDYLLRLSLHDNFTQQDIPPLSQDFHEYQTYYVEFQIK